MSRAVRLVLPLVVLASCGGAVASESDGASDAGAPPTASPPPPQPSLPDASFADASSGADAGPSTATAAFEDGFEGESGACTGWTTTHATATVVPGGHSGQHACRVCGAPTGSIERRVALTAPVGSPVGFSAFTRAETAPTSVSWSFSIDGFARNGGVPLRPPGTWIEQSFDGRATMPVTSAFIAFHVEYEACFLLDDVRITVE